MKTMILILVLNKNKVIFVLKPKGSLCNSKEVLCSYSRITQHQILERGGILVEEKMTRFFFVLHEANIPPLLSETSHWIG